jgi:hypothetical protein
MLLNFALKHAIWKVLENQYGWKLNSALYLLVYDDAIIQTKNVHTINSDTEALVVASKETGLE